MAITLGAVALPDLIIDNEFGLSGIQAVVKFSLGGTPLIFEQERGGKPLDLVGTADSGWITKATLLSLRAMASVPRATYLLSYENTNYTVRFRNESQPVIEAEPVLPRPNQEVDDWYANVRIKLMDVGGSAATATTTTTV